MSILNLIANHTPNLECVVRDAIPVPFFGNDRGMPKYATVGINPSQNEFPNHLPFRTTIQVNVGADENLTLPNAEIALQKLQNYFTANPYWKFFYALEDVLIHLDASYRKNAVHLDLVPWATDPAWGELNDEDRDELLPIGLHHFPSILNTLTSIECLLANGSKVTRHLEEMAGIQVGAVEWEPMDIPDRLWKLKHWNYEVSGRKLRVVGWNYFLPYQHMPNTVKHRIRDLLAV